MPKAKLICVLLLAIAASELSAQLRIVDYNTAGGPRNGMATILEAIGDEDIRGLQRPIDVLALQEQFSSAMTTAAIVDILNGIYGEGIYDQAISDGDTRGAGRPGLVFNTHTVELIDEIAIGTVGSMSGARQTLRYQLRPIEYGSDADFFIYNSHYKAGTGSTDKARRLDEATTIREDSDALGDGRNIIYLGDFNIRSSNEEMYQTLLANGPGQAFDPIDSPGTWHNKPEFIAIHTQSPSDGSVSGLAAGGVDDRFDFQLVSGELLDGVGLDYIEGSYLVFGNNGTHGLNNPINVSQNTAQPMEILNTLANVSDHLPVVADYQFLFEAFAATDFDKDGTSDVVDLDLLIAQKPANGVSVVPSENVHFDLNGSGTIDTSDVDAWLIQAALENGLASPYLHGDANLDAIVDKNDLNSVGLHWRANDTVSWSSGDFDGDGQVATSDLNELGSNWQASVSTAAPVPEPSGIALGLTCLLCFLRQRNSRC